MCPLARTGRLVRPNGIHPTEIGSASFLFFNIYELRNVSRFTCVMAFGSGSCGASTAKPT